MSHELEIHDGVADLMLMNGDAWHGYGDVVFGKDVTDKHDAMRRANHNWLVETAPLWLVSHDPDEQDLLVAPGVKMARRVCPEGMENPRHGTCFGAVGEDWTPFQNHELYDLMGAIVGDQVAFHTAGSLYGGKKVFVTCMFNEDLMVAGEEYRRYLVGINGHDGTRSLSIYPSNVRVVCDNTARYSESIAQRGGAIFWAKHTPSITDLAKKGVEIIRAEIGMAHAFKATGEKLAASKITKTEVDAFWRKLVPAIAVPNEGDTTPERFADAVTRKARADALRDLLRTTYNEKPDLADLRGTRWGVFNAITDVDSHGYKPRQNGDARFERLATGNGSSGLVQRAMPMLLAGVAA